MKILQLLLPFIATLALGQTTTVTVNTTTKQTQPPVGIIAIDGATGFKITRGTGTPEGTVTATPGSLYLDQNGLLWVKNTGTGNTGWASAGGGGTPGGSNTQFQFNNSSAFGGVPSMTYNTGGTLVTLQAGAKFNLADP